MLLVEVDVENKSELAFLVIAIGAGQASLTVELEVRKIRR